MSYIQSENIRAFPVATRSETKDINAKIPTEHNLINIINRLTGKHAFVIEGLNISDGVIKAGTCNIHGFIFNLRTDYTITTNGSGTNTLLVFQIKVYKDSEDQFERLVAFDNPTNQIDRSSEFRGLNIEVINPANYVDRKVEGNVVIYTLQIAEWSDGAWKDIQYENSDETLTRTNTLSQWASKISMPAYVGSDPSFNHVEQDLETYLRNNYILDDGIVE